MEKLPIKIYKNAKGDPMEGSFFIKALSFDDLISYQEKLGKDEDERARLLQMCLVNEDGERVFKPQQIKVIKDRMSGSHYMSALIVATNENDFDLISKVGEKYAKNTSGDLT